MDELNILFTSVGRRVELIRAFKGAYTRLGLNGRIFATDVDPLAPAMQEVDIPLLVPRSRDPAFKSRLLEICETQNIGAVLPLIDPDIPLLAAHKQTISDTGAIPVVVDPSAAKICGDKWAAYEFFRSLGLPTPRSWIPESMDDANVEFPLFIKPRDGSAAEQTYKVNNPTELKFFQDYVRNPIVQEFLPGPEITSDIVCDLHGNVISVVSRQRIAVRGGEVVKGVTVYDPRISDACELIANRLPAVGPITAQCMMNDGVPHFIEINARLGGGVPLAIAAGVDVPAMILSCLSGGLVEPVEPGSYTQGLHMTRFDESFFTTEVTRVEVKSNRL